MRTPFVRAVTSRKNAMLASLLIVFREVLEAGLIVGIVLAATNGAARRAAWVAGGIGAGVAGAALLAVFAGAVSDALAGFGQEVFTAGVLLVAVAMLSWHQLWMASHGREIARQMRAMGEAVALGRKSLLALAIVVATAVLREGAEVVLFLYGIAASAKDGMIPLLIGGLGGIGLGGLVSYLLFRGLVAIPVGKLFSVTGWLIALLAAGMASQAVGVLAGASLIPTWGDQVWNTKWLLSENSLAGHTLHTLIGYSDRPMGVQVVAYVCVLGALMLGVRLLNRPRVPSAAPQH